MTQYQFIHFLKSNSCESKFKSNFKETHTNTLDEFLKITDQYLIITKAFHWRKTSEGMLYWKNIEDKYIETLKKQSSFNKSIIK